MSNLLRQLLVILAAVAIGGGAYLYLHPAPCSVPLSYDIGTFDTSLA